MYIYTHHSSNEKSSLLLKSLYDMMDDVIIIRMILKEFISSVIISDLGVNRGLIQQYSPASLDTDMAMTRTVFFCLDSTTGRVFRRVVCMKEADFEKDSFSLMRPETSRNNDQYA